MEILVKTIINEPVDSNCFVLYRPEYPQCIVVDPGTTDCMALTLFLTEAKLVPEYIILTHEHFDHIAGVNKLKDTYGCKIISSEECSNRIVNNKKNMSLFYDQKGFITYPADLLINEIGYQLDWVGTRLLFFETQGHSEGSISFSAQEKLFTGDCVIQNQKTITKLPGGSKAKLAESIAHYKNNFDPEHTIIYPGHGPLFEMNEFDINDCI